MIKVMVLSGSFEGRVRFFLGTKVIESLAPVKLGEEINPADLFSGFNNHQALWEVDYSQASPEEIYVWFRQEIAARIFRALVNNKAVKFMDREWRWQADGSSLANLAGEIENTIVNSGFMITLLSDDEDGVVIGTSGLE